MNRFANIRLCSLVLCFLLSVNVAGASTTINIESSSSDSDDTGVGGQPLLSYEMAAHAVEAQRQQMEQARQEHREKMVFFEKIYEAINLSGLGKKK